MCFNTLKFAATERICRVRTQFFTISPCRIEASGDICGRLALGIPDEESDAAIRFVTYEISNLPLSILDRSRATGENTETELASLYLQRESAWMVDPLPVEYVIPLALTPFNFDGPVEIDDSTRIEPIDELTQMARTPSDFSATAVPDPVISAATHALVLSGHTIANPGPLKRVFRPEVNRDPLPLEEASSAMPF